MFAQAHKMSMFMPIRYGAEYLTFAPRQRNTVSDQY